MKLSEHFKNLHDKQEEIMKKHNPLSVEYDELEHLKKEKYLKKRIKYRKKLKDRSIVGVVLGLHRLFLFGGICLRVLFY